MWFGIRGREDRATTAAADEEEEPSKTTTVAFDGLDVVDCVGAVEEQLFETSPFSSTDDDVMAESSSSVFFEMDAVDSDTADDDDDLLWSGCCDNCGVAAESTGMVRVLSASESSEGLPLELLTSFSGAVSLLPDDLLQLLEADGPGADSF